MENNAMEQTKNFAAWWVSLSEADRKRVATWEKGRILSAHDVDALREAGVSLEDNFLEVKDWMLIGLGMWWSEVIVPSGKASQVLGRLHDPDGAQGFTSGLTDYRQPVKMANFHAPDEPIRSSRQPFTNDQIAFLEEAGKHL